MEKKETMRERMLAGKTYLAKDEELREIWQRSQQLTHEFNQTGPSEIEKRKELLKELLGSVGENYHIEPNFRCDYGKHITIGDHFYANFDCIILDICPVDIGSNVFFAPRVHVFTAAHPIDAAIRNTQLEFGKPVRIGDNVWVGGNTVINPGVTIGNNVVIGSGSVVTKDIPSNVVAAGNPCRVLRDITKEDERHWQEQKVMFEAETGIAIEEEK